jgi:hypothetical protein
LLCRPLLWGLFFQLWQELGLSSSRCCGARVHQILLPGYVVRLKLAFCMTCAVHVLVLAQGPSFRDLGRPC